MRYLIIPSAAAFLLLTACNASNTSLEKDYAAAADSTSFAGDASQINSSSRKIARTADLRCRVRNVQEATLELETKVQQLGGLAAQSTIENQSTEQRMLNYKPDSLKQVTSYTPVAHLVLRVPERHLDSLLRLLPRMSEFTDYRNITQDDKTLAYLANALKNEALRPAQLKAKIADTGANTLESVDRRIQNLQILDEVHYATVSVELIQPMQIYTTTVVNTDYMTTEPFGSQLANSLSKGWLLVQSLVVALVAAWPLWLIVAGGWSWYVVRKRKVAN
ncbi:DUF4349 domain-containing protein [Polluticoccus soli]|uniref:DUF4349 domain-containing protein n=1 Tax=Polluticoccus soli TaxID=3034150 RepID=UPI0023E34226|nr:DUF4349 domain-containing protein [Flavipsychrobacter sp. JY13-12]